MKGAVIGGGKPFLHGIPRSLAGMFAIAFVLALVAALALILGLGIGIASEPFGRDEYGRYDPRCGGLI